MMPPMLNNTAWSWRHTTILMVVLAMAALGWSYWPVFVQLSEQWVTNPLYSHGFLVPTFALVLLWLRRDLIPAIPLKPSLWALAFLIVGSTMRLSAAHFFLTWADSASLLFM